MKHAEKARKKSLARKKSTEAEGGPHVVWSSSVGVSSRRSDGDEDTGASGASRVWGYVPFGRFLFGGRHTKTQAAVRALRDAKDKEARRSKTDVSLKPTTLAATKSSSAQALASMLQDEADDMLNDLVSLRWLAFYTVPKVKFALHFLSHIGLIVYCTVLFMQLKDDFHDAHATGATVEIWHTELVLWVWSAARIVGLMSELPTFSLKAVRLKLRDPFKRIDYSIITIMLVIMFLRVYANTTNAAVDRSVLQLPMDLYAVLVNFLPEGTRAHVPGARRPLPFAHHCRGAIRSLAVCRSLPCRVPFAHCRFRRFRPPVRVSWS